jgi:hypothetical protein
MGKGCLDTNERLQNIPETSGGGSQQKAKEKRQGYEGNTNNAPTMIQQANNGASQGQNQPSQGNDNDGGY